MFVLNLYTQLEHSASLMDNSGRLMFLIIEFSHIFFFVLWIGYRLVNFSHKIVTCIQIKGFNIILTPSLKLTQLLIFNI